MTTGGYDVRRYVLQRANRTTLMATVLLSSASWLGVTGCAVGDGTQLISSDYELALEPIFIGGQSFLDDAAVLKLLATTPEGVTTVHLMGDVTSGTRLELLEQPVLAAGTTLGLLAETGLGADDQWNPSETLAYGQLTLDTDLALGAEQRTIELLMPSTRVLELLGSLNENKVRMLSAVVVAPGGAAYIFGGMDPRDALFNNAEPAETILKMANHNSGGFGYSALETMMPETTAVGLDPTMPLPDAIEVPFIGRIDLTATMVSIDDTDLVLVAGGRKWWFTTDFGTDQAFLFDPATDTVVDSFKLKAPRSKHIAVPFAGGDVLFAGGLIDGFIVTQPSVEVFEADRTRFVRGDEAGTIDFASLLMSGAALDDDVIVCGGATNQGLSWVPSTGCNIVRPSGEIEPAAPLPIPLAGAAMASLPDGGVLITGGFSATYTDPNPPTDFGNAPSENRAFRFDPSTKQWIEVGPMAHARSHHAALSLPSGEVLVVGGTGVGTVLFGPLIDPVRCPELYNPVTRMFTQLDCTDAGQGAHVQAAVWPGEHVVAIEGINGFNPGSDGAHGMLGVGPSL